MDSQPARQYSEEELGVLRSLFDSCDHDRTGKIHINQLPGLLGKLGKSQEDMVAIMEQATHIADDHEGQVNFNNFVSVIENFDGGSEMPFEGPDPKVLEFLRILEEYRVKCEEEGNYLEAGRAHKQLSVLRKQEEKRQQKAVKARQISERQDVQLAHNMQFHEFNQQWDRYMEEFDNMAQTYIQQMTERHAMVLLEFQKQLREELAKKPPRWSRELLEMRRRQHLCARNKNYTEAQKLKSVCDKAEEKERSEAEQSVAIVFARREAQFRLQQQTELQALLKRIECRRKEHIKQRNADCKRLLQRNRNVQTVLESKQNLESQKLFDDIRKNLHQTNVLTIGGKTGGSSTASLPQPQQTQRATTKARQPQQSAEYNQYGESKHGGGGGYDGAGGSPEFLEQGGPNFGSMLYEQDDRFDEEQEGYAED